VATAVRRRGRCYRHPPVNSPVAEQFPAGLVPPT